MDWKALSHLLVSISSDLVKEPTSLCNTDPHRLVTSIIGALEKLALQSKAILKHLFLNIKTTINFKLGSILEKLTHRYNRREQAVLDDCDNVTCTSTQFLQIRTKQFYDQQDHLERSCNFSPMLVFKSTK